MKEKRPWLRATIEITGWLVGIVGAIIILLTWQRDQVRETASAQHDSIQTTINAETQARKTGDEVMLKAIDGLVKSTDSNTKAIGKLTMMVNLVAGEMRVVMHRMDLGDGG